MGHVVPDDLAKRLPGMIDAGFPSRGGSIRLIRRTARQAGPRRGTARFDWAYDPNAAESAESIGVDPSKLLELLDANEATIEDAGVVMHSYTAPGNSSDGTTYWHDPVGDLTAIDHTGTSNDWFFSFSLRLWVFCNSGRDSVGRLREALAVSRV
jgi:hypothetical protein